jgi:hypothetical protein
VASRASRFIIYRQSGASDKLPVNHYATEKLGVWDAKSARDKTNFPKSRLIISIARRSDL